MNSTDRYLAYLDAFNRRDFDAVRAMMRPDIVDHHLPPEVPTGADGVIGWLELLAAFLSIQVEVSQVVEADQLVAVSGRIRGVHVGDFPGLPATNRPYDVAITSIERFADGLLAERWETYDEAGLMAQLNPWTVRSSEGRV